MNFYEYLEDSNGEVIERVSLMAAQSLIEHGLQVIPLKGGSKEPVDGINNLARLRQHPINEHNAPFYFDRDSIDIGIMLRKNMEVIDIDEKNLKGITNEILTTLEQANPELYDKLCIERTPTGGAHILYYSEIIGGSTVLAQVNATPHPVAIVERINETNKSYIKCSPSLGYEFIQGNPMSMPTLTGEERNWLSAFVASYNKILIPEVKRQESDRLDSPWAVFNNQNDWQYILNELLSRGWTVHLNLDTRISIQRPGSKQHSGNIWKDTNTLYLFTASSEFKPEQCYSAFGVYAHYYHDGNTGMACRQLASEGIGVNLKDEGQFWKRDKKKIIVKYTQLMNWLHLIGYRIYENEIVKITDNIVSIIEERDLKAAFLKELEPEMVDTFYERVSGIFNDSGGVMSMLERLEDKFITDTQTETWIFFKNYAVKITGEEILPMQYKEVSGYIWSTNIIDRNFYNDDYSNCDAERFVQILGGAKHNDLCKLIGYSLSRYKDALNPRAVVLNEDIDSEDEGESQGGTGKGLLFAFIRQFRKVAEFDGQNFKFNDSFLYQNVDVDTSIIFIDDAEEHFKFTALFSILTGALLVNKKNKPQILIPFHRSPKVFITSNFSVGKMDISTQRRKYEFAVTKHFGTDLQPIDEFGRQFFDGWDVKEWSRFDNFIAYCAQIYLADTNHKAIGNVTLNSTERSLISNTNKDFIEYMDSQLQCNFFDFAPNVLKTFSGEINGVYVTNGVDYDKWYSNSLQKEPDRDLLITISKPDLFTRINDRLKIKYLTPTKLTRWLKRWAEIRGVEIDTRYQFGSSYERVNLFKSWRKTDEIDSELTF